MRLRDPRLLIPVVAPPVDRVMSSSGAHRVLSGTVTGLTDSVVGEVRKSAIPAEALAIAYGAAALTRQLGCPDCSAPLVSGCLCPETRLRRMRRRDAAER
jgi:hypothetical protein